MKADLILIALTVLLVIGACLLFLRDSVGWAQFLLVMASGTAGGAVVLLTEHWGPND